MTGGEAETFIQQWIDKGLDVLCESNNIAFFFFHMRGLESI